jgi:hypothetical protein
MPIVLNRLQDGRPLKMLPWWTYIPAMPGDHRAPIGSVVSDPQLSNAYLVL